MRRPHRSHTLLGSLLTPLLSAALPTFVAGQDASVSAENSSSSRALFQIAAVRVDRSPTVDGLLDEELWEQAFVVDAFVQQEPSEGAPASERTEVRVMYDGSTLYIGFTAWDSSPFVATEKRRDGDRILDEDNFPVILDTFMDSRSAYTFVVSPLGAMLDQQVFEEGVGGSRGPTGNPNLNREWDGVWRASARTTANGWTAEIAIPMITLRFPNTPVQSWGINFQRTISRKNETVFWAPIPKAYGLTRVSLAGTLTGLESLDRGRDLRLKPYAIAGGRSERSRGASDRSTSRDAGLDLKYGITAGLNLDLTLNTDFAQAEADDEQANLTRFALFFPEKRDFFLEDAGQFTVATAQSFGGRMADLFFTRRIGISETGQPTPILAGLRLTGKIGRNNIAVMDIQTDDAFGNPGENFFVARYSRDVLSRSRVGALVVNKHASSGGHYNRTFASDLVYVPHPNLTVTTFLASTSTRGVSGDNLGWNIRAAWLSESWRLAFDHTDLQDNFNAEVGFVPRVGIRRSQIHIEPNPRPGRYGIRVMEPMWIAVYTTDQTGRLVSRHLHYMYAFRFENGAYLNFWHNRYFERLDDPFRVAPDVVISSGDYNFHDWRVSFDSSPSRRVNFGFSWEPQTFYDGDRTDITLNTGVRVTPQLALVGRYTKSDVDLPVGSFQADVGSLQVDYALSPNMSFRSITQYNSLSEQWSTSARFRYIYRPGSDIYVVYDEVRRTPTGVANQSESRNRQLLIKMTYLFSF